MGSFYISILAEILRIYRTNEDSRGMAERPQLISMDARLICDVTLVMQIHFVHNVTLPEGAGSVHV